MIYCRPFYEMSDSYPRDGMDPLKRFFSSFDGTKIFQNPEEARQIIQAAFLHDPKGAVQIMLFKGDTRTAGDPRDNMDLIMKEGNKTAAMPKNEREKIPQGAGDRKVR